MSLHFNQLNMKLEDYTLLITELAGIAQTLPDGDGRGNIEAKYDRVIELANNIALLADTDKKEFMEHMDALRDEECRADAEGEDVVLNADDYE